MYATPLQTAKEWGVLYELVGEIERRGGNGNLYEKNPTPRIIVRNPSAQHGADRGREHRRNPVERKSESALLRRKAVIQDRLGHGLESPAANSLDGSAEKQHGQARCQATQQRANGEHKQQIGRAS